MWFYSGMEPPIVNKIDKTLFDLSDKWGFIQNFDLITDFGPVSSSGGIPG
jgi:hypothetical protein